MKYFSISKKEVDTYQVIKRSFVFVFFSICCVLSKSCLEIIVLWGRLWSSPLYSK